VSDGCEMLVGGTEMVGEVAYTNFWWSSKATVSARPLSRYTCAKTSLSSLETRRI
jgi:hypothetical protein